MTIMRMRKKSFTCISVLTKKHYIKLLDNGSECYIFSGNSSLNSGKRLDLSEGEESNKTIFEEIKKLIDNKSFFR